MIIKCYVTSIENDYYKGRVITRYRRYKSCRRWAKMYLCMLKMSFMLLIKRTFYYLLLQTNPNPNPEILCCDNVTLTLLIISYTNLLTLNLLSFQITTYICYFSIQEYIYILDNNTFIYLMIQLPTHPNPNPNPIHIYTIPIYIYIYIYQGIHVLGTWNRLIR